MADHEDSESICDLIVSGINIWLMVYSYQRNSIVWHVWGISFNNSNHIGGLSSSIMIRLTFNGFTAFDYISRIPTKNIFFSIFMRAFQQRAFLIPLDTIQMLFKSWNFNTCGNHREKVVQKIHVTIKKYINILISSRGSCSKHNLDIDYIFIWSRRRC